MKRNVERMRYKNDSLSAGLCLLAIAFNVTQFVLIYSNKNVIPNYTIGIDVIINILFMLVAFWASEQAKVYSRGWAVGIAVLGAVQFARLFWLPEEYHALGQLTGTPYLVVRLCLIASAAVLLLASVISMRNSMALHRYLKGIGTKA